MPSGAQLKNEKESKRMNSRKMMMTVIVFVFAAVAVTGNAFAADMHTSTKFEGPKANTGTVAHSKKDGKNILTFSDDFVVPDTPDPHAQVIDSKGNVYQLDKLKIKGLVGDKVKKEITVPDYVKDIKTVVIYCAWAEANLGQASFAQAVK
jgi:hypothetical protein